MSRVALAVAKLAAPADSPRSDTQLVRAFLDVRANDAFEELMRRHGPMVLAACRRVLGDADDADDAFQATFLVLARKAHSIRGANLGGWLYGVAVRTARGIRLSRDRREKRDQAAALPAAATGPDSAAADRERAAVLDAELAQLPAHLRDAIVLCELRGYSRKQAASELGIREGTLSSRLAAAKRKLAERLGARGLALSTLSALVPTTVPAALAHATAAAVAGVGSGTASAAAAIVLKGMLFEQLRAGALAAALVISAVCGVFATTGAPAAADAPTAPAPRAPTDRAAELVKQLGSAQFAEREAAETELRALGAKAEAALRAGAKFDEPEVRSRCSKLLIVLRKDALAALQREFDANATQPSDHPLWVRFAALAGDSPASRALFATFVTRANLAFDGIPSWLSRLDAASTGPAEAAEQYRAALKEIAEARRANLRVSFLIPVWPGDHAHEAAYLLFLGSFAGTESADPKDTDTLSLFDEGEGALTFAKGLKLGLRGEQLQTARWEEKPEKGPTGTADAFTRLLGGWLVRRANGARGTEALQLALDADARGVLPAVRELVRARDTAPRFRALAFQALHQLGTKADAALLVPHFDDEAIALQHSNKDQAVVTQVNDAALGFVLLFAGHRPEDCGFEVPRAVSVPEVWHMGFTDGDTRRAAHAKARAALKVPKDPPKPPTFDEQVKAAEARAKELALHEVRSATHDADPRFPVRFKTKSGELRLTAGSSVLAELPEATPVFEWHFGTNFIHELGAKHGPKFTHVLFKWEASGAATWTAYRAPDPVAVKLVAQLGSAQFVEREAAEKALRALGAKAELAVRIGLKFDEPEVRARCERLLPLLRKDALAALVRDFDAKKDVPGDHAIWHRFAETAGNTPASRALFARLLKKPEWLARFDAAETGRAAAAKEYQAFVAAGGALEFFRLRSSGELRDADRFCETLDEAAALLFLGSYPGATNDPALAVRANDSFHHGEGMLFRARGLALALQGKELTDKKGETAALPESTNRAAAKLFAAWLANRTTEATAFRAFELAVAHGAYEVLPVARRVAADAKAASGARVGALAALAQFGAPDDLKLFAPLFDDPTEVKIPPPPSEYSPGPRSRYFVAADRALGLALLLCDRDPADFGFDRAKGKFNRANGRPDVSRYPAEEFGFGPAGGEVRAAAHKKARAFLDEKLPKPEPKKPDPVALVKQLGSAQFAEREAAEKELRALGMSAEPALLAGAKSDEPEVRARCARLLPLIRGDALDALAKSFDPAGTAEPDHPVWARFKSIAGASKDARRLFAELLADPRLARVLDGAEREPAARIHLYRNEVARVSCEARYAYANELPGGYRLTEGGPRAAELKPPPAPLRAADFAALFQIGSYAEAADDVPGKDRAGFDVREALFAETRAFRSALESPPVRALFAAWLDRRTDRSALESAYFRASTERCAEAVPAARRLLAAEKAPAPAKAYAALYLARCGDRSDAARVSHLFDTETVARAVIYNDKPAPVQVRDAALAAALLLSGENPADYGFDVLKARASRKADAYDFAWLGFYSDESRAAVHKKAREWLDADAAKRAKP